MLLAGDPGRDEDSQMADRIVDRVDDRLPMLADLVDILVKIENPSERLLRRRDVVALRAEHHDRRADVAQVDGGAVGGPDQAGRQLVADEQLINDELDFLRIQVDMAAPPALEAQIARRSPCRSWSRGCTAWSTGIGGVLVLEVLHEPGPVELAVAEVAREGGQPAPAQETAAVAHRILPAHAGPVGERRACDDERPEQLGPSRGQHHERPAGLTIADHAWLAIGLGMQGDDSFQKDGLSRMMSSMV